jgi:hypothetical protein
VAGTGYYINKKISSIANEYSGFCVVRQAVLRIRITFMRIRLWIRTYHFGANLHMDPNIYLKRIRIRIHNTACHPDMDKDANPDPDSQIDVDPCDPDADPLISKKNCI